jgi:ubiquitin carboxyl-terminal hydrolase 5/13
MAAASASSLSASLAKTPQATDRVHKEECLCCFKNAFTEGGLYVNLKSWQAYCPDHVSLDLGRAGAPALYLHQQSHKVPLEPQPTDAAVPTELAIGTAGGFDVNKKNYTVETESSVVLLPEGTRYTLPCPELPEAVLNAVMGVQAHEGASKEAVLAAWQEERKVSKYAAGLEQLPAAHPISTNPADWKCDETGVTENLWLNLSTGHIGSGRQHWDGTGGNGAAMRHYKEMKKQGKKYPLVVKLGTITGAGADVYSYATSEEDEVLDPALSDHLGHWGIDMSKASFFSRRCWTARVIRLFPGLTDGVRLADI